MRSCELKLWHVTRCRVSNDDWIIECLLLVTPNNYNTLTEVHKLEVTTDTKKCPSPAICCLVASPNKGNSLCWFRAQWPPSSVAGVWLLATNHGPGLAIAQLVAGFPPRRPGFDPKWSPVGFMVNVVAPGHVFPEHFGFSLPIPVPPKAPHLCIIRSWYNRPVSGWRTKWTRCHPTSQDETLINNKN
jgi:hypothetical protein